MKSKILIVGGSGYLGQKLTHFLDAQHYEVCWLTRQLNPQFPTTQFLWNYHNKTCDLNAFNNVSVVINLGGASINKKWTKKYKAIMYESRVLATNYLCTLLNDSIKNQVRFIHISGTGFYGTSIRYDFQNETQSAGNDWLAQLCYDWEQATHILNNNFSTIILRIPPIVAEDSMLFLTLKKSYFNHLYFCTGNGFQPFPTLHLTNFLNGIETCLKVATMSGIFNMVDSEQLILKEFIKKYVLKSKYAIFIPIPKFILQIILLDLAAVICSGNYIDGAKFKDLTIC
ncbi:MAG: NAD-dependent epimerase/dehydratase family protein [Sediminibacterium sp.]|nr:NAD-dependent epimerase/dehydratase family protein [Sediminibacterium sp.]